MTLLFLALIAIVVYYVFIYKKDYKNIFVNGVSKKCPNCGSNVEKDFNLCPICKETLRKKCNSCGNIIQTEWKYCPYCENTLRKDDEK